MTAAFVRAIAEDERAANERSTPEFRKYADQCFNRAMARLRTQMDNGAGLAMDGSLRDFLLEYNHRGWSHGLDSFPSSFNILEAFLKRDEKLAYFRLREEADHLVDIPRFFDYVTGSAAPSIALELASTIEDGVIYNFNATDPFHQLSFRGTENDDFVVSGATMVRHGHELSMVVLLGQIADLAERTRDLVHHSEMTVAPGKEGLRPHEDFTRRAEPLLGSENHWRCLVMLRFDLESETRDAAYVSFDCGDVYQTTTDDISTFDGVRGTLLSDDEIRDYMDRIREYEPLIEVARACLYLPLMFDSLSDEVDVERHETRYRSERNKVERRKDRKLVPPQLRVSHRNVATLAATGRPAPDRFGFQSSTMRMDVSGYWKKLPAGSVGQDKRGREIHGRTWVHRELRWHERATGAAVATRAPTSHGASHHAIRGARQGHLQGGPHSTRRRRARSRTFSYHRLTRPLPRGAGMGGRRLRGGGEDCA
jgi:hypothetical protein